MTRHRPPRRPRSTGASAASTGWICPRCTRVYSPSEAECSTCNAAVISTSTTTTSTWLPDGGGVTFTTRPAGALLGAAVLQRRE